MNKWEAKTIAKKIVAEGLIAVIYEGDFHPGTTHEVVVKSDGDHQPLIDYDEALGFVQGLRYARRNLRSAFQMHDGHGKPRVIYVPEESPAHPAYERKGEADGTA